VPAAIAFRITKFAERAACVVVLTDESELLRAEIRNSAVWCDWRNGSGSAESTAESTKDP
jgi:hypothetical protein